MLANNKNNKVAIITGANNELAVKIAQRLLELGKVGSVVLHSSLRWDEGREERIEKIQGCKSVQSTLFTNHDKKKCPKQDHRRCEAILDERRHKELIATAQKYGDYTYFIEIDSDFNSLMKCSFPFLKQSKNSVAIYIEADNSKATPKVISTLNATDLSNVTDAVVTHLTRKETKTLKEDKLVSGMLIRSSQPQAEAIEHLLAGEKKVRNQIENIIDETRFVVGDIENKEFSDVLKKLQSDRANLISELFSLIYGNAEAIKKVQSESPGLLKEMSSNGLTLLDYIARLKLSEGSFQLKVILETLFPFLVDKEVIKVNSFNKEKIEFQLVVTSREKKQIDKEKKELIVISGMEEPSLKSRDKAIEYILAQVERVHKLMVKSYEGCSAIDSVEAKRIISNDRRSLSFERTKLISELFTLICDSEEAIKKVQRKNSALLQERTLDGSTLLHYVERLPVKFSKQKDIFNSIFKLVSKEVINFNAVDHEGKTALHHAAEKNNNKVDVFRKFLREAIKRKYDFSQLDAQGMAVIHYAAANNCLPILLQEVPNIDVGLLSQKGKSPAEYVKHFDFKMIKILIQKGAPIDSSMENVLRQARADYENQNKNRKKSLRSEIRGIAKALEKRKIISKEFREWQRTIAIEKTDAYIEKRTKERRSGKKYYSVFGWIRGLDTTLEINTAEKIKCALAGKLKDHFSVEELKAASNGKVGARVGEWSRAGLFFGRDPKMRMAVPEIKL